MSDALTITWTVAHQTPPSMGYSRQEYWNGLPFPPLGIFPTQGWNPGFDPMSIVLEAGFFIAEPPGMEL